MKTLYSLILTIFLILTFTQCSSTNEEWSLVFEDEFDENLEQWNLWNSGAFNQEIQMYRPEQVSLEEGNLVIRSKRMAVSGPTNIHDSTLKEFEYVSGRLESKQLFAPNDEEGEREYRFMARIKLPAGHGMWPAFWTYGMPWPQKGEIDVVEARGGEPYTYQSNLFYGPQTWNINKNTRQIYETEEDLTADFHVYEMIWRQNSIDMLRDGKLLHSYQANDDNNISKYFGKEHMVVLNTAVGGGFIRDKNSANFADSAQMLVDWVRVYRK